MILILLIGLLIGSAHLILPDEYKFERTYHGEGVNCDGTSASVKINENTVIESEEGVVIAVEQAVTQALTAIKSNPSTASVVQEALDASQKVLEVVANAIATVSAEINSPNPGCWAIAYGKAQAAAIAKATVHAIVTGFEEAIVTGGSVQTIGLATDIQTDVEVAIEEIAVLLADGSGRGPLSQQSLVKAIARARTVDCTLAQAFASITNDIQEAEVIAQTGCLKATNVSLAFPLSGISFHSCECVNLSSKGAPKNCGQWGGRLDYICYVKDPSKCPCAVSSSIYSNMSWRYCGPTLKEMQQWLSYTNENNKIFSKPPGFGYCADLKYQDDKISRITNPTTAAVSTLALAPTQNGGSILSP